MSDARPDLLAVDINVTTRSTVVDIPLSAKLAARRVEFLADLCPDARSPRIRDRDAARPHGARYLRPTRSIGIGRVVRRRPDRVQPDTSDDPCPNLPAEAWFAHWTETAIREAIHEALEFFQVDGSP